MAAAAPCTSRRSFRDSLKVLEADIQHANTLALPQGVGLLAGLRRGGVPADAHLVQPRRAHLPLPPAAGRLQRRRRAHLPLPPAAGRLQRRRRARPPQDPHLVQGLCGRHHSHLSTHERKASTKEFFLRCDVSLPCATGTRDQRN
ncbi:uncharacterized protein [Triticum aestivum]|uniref:uncharacterized protein n=1 Tax=Triticum aestivum TaxID=4565 RepID=UPI001D0251A3|nr:uncharacterized protein LOC123055246 [Triticum aestivum]